MNNKSIIFIKIFTSMNPFFIIPIVSMSDSININSIDTLSLVNCPYISSLKIESLLNDMQRNDIFYEQLYESKLTFADAIIYDITLDTIETQIHFQSLFEFLHNKKNPHSKFHQQNHFLFYKILLEYNPSHYLTCQNYIIMMFLIFHKSQLIALQYNHIYCQCLLLKYS